MAEAQCVGDKMVDSGRAPSTINAVRAVVRGAFDLAVRRGDIETNPFRLVDTPTVKLPDLSIPTPEVAAAILVKSDADLDLGPALRFAAGTGARAGEVAAVRWPDVFLTGEHDGCDLGSDDTEPGVAHVHLRGTMGKVHGSLEVMPPKTRNGARAVPLNEATVRVLTAHRKRQTERRMKLGPAWRDEGWAFDDGKGGPVDPDAIARVWRKAREAAGFPEVRMHDLRHLWITYVAQESDIGDVSKLAGHGNPGFTLMRYSHPTKRSGKRVAEATGKALGDALGG